MKNLSRFDLGMIIAFVVVTLLGGGATYYTYAALGSAQSDLADAQTQLDTLTAKQPYNPTEGTIHVLKKNIETLKTQIAPIIESDLQAKGNTIAAIQNQSPVSWKIDVDNRVKALRQLADKSQVKLPNRYYFSFSRYLSASPRDDSTGELSKQLTYIEQLAMTMMSNHAIAITRILRTNDEDDESTATYHSETDILPGRVTKSADGLYLTHPFLVEFEGDTECLRGVVNQVAASPYVFIIRTISVTNSSKEIPTKTTLESMASAAASVVPDPTAVTTTTTDSGTPGATADAGAAPHATAGPKYLFGSETLKIRMRIDGIEWLGRPEKHEAKLNPQASATSNN